ncbi:hypothetical protein SKAU_G00139140 [Synaphobranchus kaupii]|uniref:Uncharacterized protein n=1 Tax=Synaphobranchus kaupii TaxID=118154 RepID=A0A9Q1FS33_SYNKA|nr:hypothetical protein SKAU_G00139140 [Synaphobranchus kaupii]
MDRTRATTGEVKTEQAGPGCYRGEGLMEGGGTEWRAPSAYVARTARHSLSQRRVSMVIIAVPTVNRIPAARERAPNGEERWKSSWC